MFHYELVFVFRNLEIGTGSKYLSGEVKPIMGHFLFVAMVQWATELQDAIRILPYGFVPDDLHFCTLWLVYTRLPGFRRFTARQYTYLGA
jgi:hypothetical protein